MRPKIEEWICCWDSQGSPTANLFFELKLSPVVQGPWASRGPALSYFTSQLQNKSPVLQNKPLIKYTNPTVRIINYIKKSWLEDQTRGILDIPQ